MKNLVPRSDDKQPVGRFEYLERPWKQHLMIASGNSNDLNPGMFWNLQFAKRITGQTAVFRNFHRFQPDFVQQIGALDS